MLRKNPGHAMTPATRISPKTRMVTVGGLSMARDKLSWFPTGTIANSTVRSPDSTKRNLPTLSGLEKLASGSPILSKGLPGRRFVDAESPNSIQCRPLTCFGQGCGIRFGGFGSGLPRMFDSLFFGRRSFPRGPAGRPTILLTALTLQHGVTPLRRRKEMEQPGRLTFPGLW